MVSLRTGANSATWMILGVAAILLTLGVLWPLLALGTVSPPTADAHPGVTEGNQFSLPDGLIFQTGFPSMHPGAVNPPRGVEGDSSDNWLVLALSSTAFLLLATLPMLLRRKVRRIGSLGEPRSANLVDRSLTVAPSMGS